MKYSRSFHQITVSAWFPNILCMLGLINVGAKEVTASGLDWSCVHFDYFYLLCFHFLISFWYPHFLFIPMNPLAHNFSPHLFCLYLFCPSQCHFLSSLARPLCPGTMMHGSTLEKMSRSDACWSDLVVGSVGKSSQHRDPVEVSGIF